MQSTLRLRALTFEFKRTLKTFALYRPTCLTMQQLLDFGAKHYPAKNSFLFLQKELPVRLANIIHEMSLLPSVLLETPSVVQLREWYDLTFKEVREFSNLNPDKPKVLENFMVTLKNVKNRHSTVIETMAEGVKEMRRTLVKESEILESSTSSLDESTLLKLTSTYSASRSLDQSVRYFLDRFYMNRIGVNMLLETHLSLFSRRDDSYQDSSSSSSSDDDAHHLIGCLDPKCDTLLIAKSAFEDAKDLCMNHYGAGVDCNFILNDKNSSEKKIKMTYVPSHLYHMLFELFKNSLKATIDRYSDDGTSKPPNLECLINRGHEDIIFKISDRGKGIARSNLRNIFHFQCSSSRPPPPPSNDNFSLSPLSGYGYGLPLSRLYARYFSGDLWLNSIEGYGTDAMIALKANPSEAMEVLPLMSKSVSGHYSSHVQAADWSDSRHFKRHDSIHDNEE